MAKKSQVEEFDTYLEAGQFDEAEKLLAKMVEEIPADERTGPFTAPVRMKKQFESEAAELSGSGTEIAGAIALPIANRLSRRLRNAKFRFKIATGFSGLVIVSEGDSWFQYPVILDDTIDELSRDEDKAIYSLGAAGDLLENMADQREYLSAIAETGAKYFLLSGGGNDFLGGGALEGFLHNFQNGADAADLIDQVAVDQKLNQIKSWYTTIVDDVAMHHPGVQIFGHAYDVSYPETDGRWLGTPFQNKRIPFAIGRQIVEILLGKLSSTLSAISTSQPNFNFINLTNVVGDSVQSWHDELHPKNTGFGRVADKFREAIAANVAAAQQRPAGTDLPSVSAASQSQKFADIDDIHATATNDIIMSSFDQRKRMASEIINYEARRDSLGRLEVYYLHPDDGGGKYEVAGINERYHKEEADLLVSLIEAGRHEEAENYAVEFIAGYTDKVDRWCSNSAAEFYLRDSTFNRGPGGAARIVQMATNVTVDGVVGPITRNAIAIAESNPRDFLDKMRAARETYERRFRDETSRFWVGLVNRWNKARDFSLTFLATASHTGALRGQNAAANIDNVNFHNRILNCDASKNTENDWGYAAAAQAEVVRAVFVPQSYDLRQAWWEIGDQRRTGSCVGWATADSVLRWHFVNSGRLSQAERLSVRFSWVAAKETDQFKRRPTTFIEDAGTSLKAALDVARKFGTVSDQVLPFDREEVYDGTVQSFYTRAANLRINSYINLGNDPSQWRSWLYQNGPILTRLNVDSTFQNASKTNGILAQYNPATASGGHAIALVGYTQNGFIVRNSWSRQWGDNGYAYASNAYARTAFTESYGITV